MGEFLSGAALRSDRRAAEQAKQIAGVISRVFFALIESLGAVIGVLVSSPTYRFGATLGFDLTRRGLPLTDDAGTVTGRSQS